MKSSAVIGTIAAREFLNNLKTFKFGFGVTMSVVLVSVGTITLCRDYEARLRDHDQTRQKIAEETRKADIYSSLSPAVVRRPSPLAVLRSGLEGSFGDVLIMGVNRVPALLDAKYGSTVNPFLTRSYSFDLSRLVITVLSILAMLFGFDAVSGEKEAGTLKLILAHGVSRSRFLAGKILGGALSLSVPLLTSFAAALIIFSSRSFIVLSAAGWARTGIILFCSLLLLMTFYLLAILLSALVHKSYLALLHCFMCWVMLVLIIPNLAPYIAARIRPLTPSQTLVDQIAALDREFSEKVGEFERQNSPNSFSIDMQANFMPGMGLYGLSRGETRVQTSSRTALGYMNRFIQFAEPLRAEYADKIYRIYEHKLTELKRQDELSSQLCRFSPAFSLSSVASAAAGTDAGSYARFAEHSRQYHDQFLAYLKRHNAFASDRYFTSQFDNGEGLNFEKEVPPFVYEGESINRDMERAAIDIALLAVEPLLLAFLALIAVARYDAR